MSYCGSSCGMRHVCTYRSARATNTTGVDRLAKALVLTLNICIYKYITGATDCTEAWMDGWWLTTGALMLSSSQESCCCGCTRYRSVRNLLTLSLVFSHNGRLMGRSRALLPPTAARTSTSWGTNMVNTPTAERVRQGEKLLESLTDQLCL